MRLFSPAVRAPEAADDVPAGRFVRLATWVVAALAALLPGMQIVGALVYGGGRDWQLLVAGLLLVPPHVAVVAAAAQGRRPAAGRAVLVVAAAVMVWLSVLPGTDDLLCWATVSLTALLVLPWRWGLAVTGAVVVLTGILGGLTAGQQDVAQDNVWGWAVYYPFAIAWRTGTLAVLVWLTAASHALVQAREALLLQATVGQRAAAEVELRGALEPALQGIARRADRAAALVRDDRDGAVGELDDLVAGARRALADARRFVVRYQALAADGRPSAVDQAVRLLRTAGWRVVVRHGEVPAGAEALPLPQAVGHLLSLPRRGEVDLLVAGELVVVREPGGAA